MEQDEKTGFSFMNQPGLINIDVTGLCNKTCNYCPRSQGYPNQKEYMDWKLFRKFVLVFALMLFNYWCRL